MNSKLTNLRGAFVSGASMLTLALSCMTSTPAKAQGLIGWGTIGQVAIKDNCANDSCALNAKTTQRYRAIALSTNSTYPTVLTGQVKTICRDGTETEYLLRSATGEGIFQTIANSCVNFDLRTVTLRIDSANLAPEDARHGIVLYVYGAI